MKGFEIRLHIFIGMRPDSFGLLERLLSVCKDSKDFWVRLFFYFMKVKFGCLLPDKDAILSTPPFAAARFALNRLFVALVYKRHRALE